MDLTQPPLLYVLIAVAILVVGLLLWGVIAAGRKRRERQALQERYGAEYDRTIGEHRSTRAAVADLKQREQARDRLELRDLNEADRDLVRRHMATAQYRFVEDPADAVLQTERILTEVLRAKGYPIAANADEAARLFSVDHPDHAQSVRSVLSGERGNEVDTLRDRFLQARKTISEVTDTSFVLDDATSQAAGTTSDLRVERSEQQPAASSSRTSRP